MLDMFILYVRYVVSSFNETEITVFAKVGFENSSKYDKMCRMRVIGICL